MMVARMGSHCILLMAIGVSGQTSSSHDSRTFVLFNHRKTTWNHAHEICEENGMSMITVDSVDVYTALTLFKSNEWGDWDDFWIGLHNIGDKNSGESGYVWASCLPLGAYRPWRIGQTHGTDLCIRGDKDLDPSNDWKTKECGDIEGLPLCEKFTGSCGFREMKHKNVWSTILTPQTLNGIMTYNECLSACVNYQGVSECWGFTVNSDRCSIYESDSFTDMMDSLKGETDSIFYAKICFKGVLNTTSYSSKYGNKDDPFKGCTHAYSQPNTDTTVITEGVRTTQVNTENSVTTPEIETTPYQTTPSVTFGNTGHDYSTTSVTGYNGLADTDTITRDSGMDATVTATGGTGTRATSAGNSTDGASSTGNTETGIITSGPEPDTGGTRTRTVTGVTSTRDISASSSTDRASNTGNTEAGIITSGPETDTGGTRTQGGFPGGLYTESTIAGGPGSGIGDTQTTGTWDTETGVAVTFATRDSSAHSSSFSANSPVITSATSEEYESTLSDSSVGQVTENCRCVCRVSTLTIDERQTLIDDIIQSLTISKKNLSANIRRYVSANDNRPSAVAAGGVGIAVLSIVFGGLFLLDVGSLKRDVMNELQPF